MCVKGILTSDEIITKWKKFLLKMHDPPNSMNKNYLRRFTFPSFAISLDYCNKLIHYKTLHLYDPVHPPVRVFRVQSAIDTKIA